MPSNTVKFTPEKSPKERRPHGLGITIFSAVVLVVIVVTFIGAPVVSKVAEQPSVVFGTYDGIPIEFLQGNYFSQQVDYLNQFYEQFNTGNSDVVQQRQMVWRQAFEQSAMEVGMRHDAEKAGIVVTDKKIDTELVKNAAYQQDGAFSEELYRNTGAADRFRYRQDTENQLLIQQYTGDLSSAPKLSASTKDFVAGLAYPQRKLSYISFTDTDYPANLVTDYANKNKNLFRTINLSRITIKSSEAEAKKVRDDAVKGTKTFEELAKTYSKDALAEAGGALNIRTYQELKSEISKIENLDKVFTLGKDAISDVIAADKSWTIYKVIAPAADPDFTKPTTLDQVRAYLSQNDRGILEDYLEGKAKEFQVLATTDFAAAAKKIGKTVQKTDWLSLNYGNFDLLPALSKASQDAVIQGLTANEDFFKKAFRTPEKGVSAPVLAGNTILVLHVDEIKAAPAKDDTPITAASVDSRAVQDRTQAVQQSILSSPKFKDQFQAEFNRLFPQ